MQTAARICGCREAIEVASVALILLDIEEGFLAELSGEDRERLLRETGRLVKWCAEGGIPIVHVLTRHAPDGSTWDRKMLAAGLAVVVEDTPQCDQPAEVAPSDRDIVLTKTRMSGFFGTDLEWELVRMGVQAVIICGLYAHEAVLATAIDAYQRDFRVAIPRECVASPDPEDARVALRQLGRTVADIVDADALEGLVDSIGESGPYAQP